MPEFINFFKWFILYPLVIQLTLLLLYRFAPDKNPPKYSKVDAEKTISKFGKIYIFISLFILIFIFSIAYLLTLLLHNVQLQYLGSYAQNSKFVVGLTQWGYGIPAMLLACVVAQLGINYLLELFRYLKKATKKEWKVYIAESEKRAYLGYNFDQKKLGRITVTILAPLSLIWILLALNTYTLIDHTGIIYNKFFSLKERHYPMENVTDIYYIQSYFNKKSKKIVSTRPYYSVKISDGFSWNTENISVNKTEKEKEIINYISARSGVHIKKGIGNSDD